MNISVGVYFVNMTLYFECRINKNVFLQTVFWRFCPLGNYTLCNSKIFTALWDSN